MVWKQILKDLRKEWTWAFFYTVVATMIAMAILYLSVSFSSVQRQSAAIRSFIRQNVVMFQMKTVQMEPNPEGAAPANRQQKNPDAVLDYLQHSLSADGKAGSFVFVGNDGYVDKKYTQILILFGQYSTLAGLHYDGDMALFVPEAHREDAGGSVTISGREIETVANAGVHFDLFHPLHYIEPDNPLLSDTLILCTRDFQAVNKMFPWWGLRGEVFGRMVLVDPSDAEIEQLQKLFYEQKGILYTGISTEDFTQITTSASIRAHRLYILFYLLSGALLVILLICNIIRIIADKLKSTVKHLSGGERQRVAIIRSMVNDQKIILADEPTGSLDKDNSAIVIHCLRELAHELQRAVVIVTHDPDVARQCDRTFLLADGSLTPCAL